MKHFSEERKQAIIKKMLPPHNVPVSRLVKEEGISDVTLYTWRKKARQEGLVVPVRSKDSGKWLPEEKLSIVIETASLNEAELSEYCRKKGIYVEQIKQWKVDSMQGIAISAGRKVTQDNESKQDKKRVKHLEKELKRTEKL